jgi:hypothetical protein
MEVRAALFGQKEAPRIINAVVGLGGRDLPMSLLQRLTDLSRNPDAPEFLFADLETSRITREATPVNRTNTFEER